MQIYIYIYIDLIRVGQTMLWPYYNTNVKWGFGSMRV